MQELSHPPTSLLSKLAAATELSQDEPALLLNGLRLQNAQLRAALKDLLEQLELDKQISTSRAWRVMREDVL